MSLLRLVYTYKNLDRNGQELSRIPITVNIKIDPDTA